MKIGRNNSHEDKIGVKWERKSARRKAYNSEKREFVCDNPHNVWGTHVISYADNFF
jgi:hypothetical protein